MKISKKFLILLFCICVCALLFFIVQIYAKYLSTATGNTQIPIARWNIKVNNLSITSNTDISSSITPVFTGTEHIAENIIAPTSEGYFDLVFDFSAVDVSFSYLIKLAVDEKSPVQDLVATGYSIDGQDKVDFSNFNEDITDTILFTDPVDARTIRVYIMWNDNPDTSTMDNAHDSLSTTTGNPALFNVNISFTQVATTPAP